MKLTLSRDEEGTKADVSKSQRQESFVMGVDVSNVVCGLSSKRLTTDLLIAFRARFGTRRHGFDALNRFGSNTALHKHQLDDFEIVL